jgi:iron-sulfur cluster protein
MRTDLYETLTEKVKKGLESPAVVVNKRIINGWIPRRIRMEKELPMDKYRKELREIRETSARASEGMEKMAEQLIKNIDNKWDSQQRGSPKVYLAKTPEDAFKIVRQLIGDEKLVVKSKSNVINELGLVKKLETEGIKIVETDLGDRIIQLTGEKPCHPLGPAVHVPKERVAEVFSKDLGVEIKPVVSDIVSKARKGMREYFIKAKVGMTGANAVATNQGVIALIENEGNISLVTRLPSRHIAITGINKLVPCEKDAFHVVLCEALFGVGRPFGEGATYVSMITGPSRTGDVEATMAGPMHGAEEVHLILVDNWRSKAWHSPYKESLYCINCGACLRSCPVYYEIGPEFGERYIGGYGAVVAGLMENVERAVESGLFFCTGCSACKDWSCPAEVDIPEMIQTMRMEAVKSGYRLPPHEKLVKSIKENRNPYVSSKAERVLWQNDLTIPDKAEVLYWCGCTGALRTPEIPKSIVKIFSAANVAFTNLKGQEGCCGSPLLRTGYVDEFQEVANENVRVFKDRGIKRIITMCPGCYRTFKADYPKYVDGFEFEVLHATEVIEDLIEKGKIKPTYPINLQLTYHDPCHLGRHMGIYEPPRKIIESLPGTKLIEMNLNRNFARCCGAGSGVLSAFPDIAFALGTDNLRDAEKSGAQALVTACPFCELNFKYSMDRAGSTLKIYDVAELIAKSISA